MDAGEQNLFAWLAEGPSFLLFALVIGLIVSIDVFVVEFTRDYKTTRAVKEAPGRRLYMAKLHAIFHAGAFLIYSFALLLIDFISIELIDLFDFPDGVGSAFVTVINFFIIIFVWWTYKGKVAEDHSTKDVSESKVDRYDMQVLVDLWRAISSSSRTSGTVIAGSVAVDMLAVSALLKVWLLPMNGADPVSSQFGIPFVDISIFGFIIGLVVFLVVVLAHALQEIVSRNKTLMIFLRLGEPLLIFYVMAGALRSMTDIFEADRIGSFHMDQPFLADAAFAILLVVSLLLANNISLRKLAALSMKGSVDVPSNQEPSKSLSEIWSELKERWPFFGVFAVVLVGVLICLGYAFSTGEEHDHLVEATGFFSTAMLILSLVFLYVPMARIDRWEIEQSKFLTQSECPRPLEFWREFLGASMAITVLNIMMFIAIDISSYSWAPLLWSVYIIGTWMLFNFRKWRFCKSSRVKSSKNRFLDVNTAELVASIGMSSSLVAVFSAVFVSKYF